MDRQLARIRISGDLLLDLFKGEHRYRAVEGVPDDAELLNVKVIEPDWVELLILSASFETVAAGQEIPLFTPHFERLSPVDHS